MVLRYRTGAAGHGGVGMAEYLSQGDVPELAAKLSAYLSSSMAPAVAGETAAIPRRDMHPLIAGLLNIDPNRALSKEEMAHLLAGHRTDGTPIPGKRIFKSTKDKARITYTDFTFSAPKSFSIALAFAPSDAERAILEECWVRANDAVVDIVAEALGKASKGDSAKAGYDPAHIAPIRYDHYTSRPTVQLADDDDTKLVTVPTAIPGDMQRHCHNIIPHVCITDDGRVAAIPLEQMKERLHEWGYLGHAFLVTNLRERGIQAEIDPKTGLSRLPDVPRRACELFQNRTDDGEKFARAYAAEQGLDWDALDPKTKIRMLDNQVARTRRAKDGTTDYRAWVKRAEQAGYRHRSVIHPEAQRGVPAPAEQARQGYEIALPFIAERLTRRATLPGSVLRQAAAYAMIGTGVRTAKDHEAVIEAFFTEGVLQNGEMTALVAAPEEGRRFNSVTTALHAAHEREAIDLLKAAAADRSGALAPAEIELALRRVAARKDLDFTGGHGRQQARMAVAFATAGRAIVGIGAAGSGKSVTLEPVIDAYHAAGWNSYGATLAWRQTHGLKGAGVGGKRRSFSRTPDTSRLVDAGIGEDRAFALAAFFKRADAGDLALSARTLVVIDEIAVIGTHDILRLARLQARHGFKIVGMGDDKQNQSIAAGHAIKLFRHALGDNHIPEIVDTVRQKRARDRDIAKLFRSGKAEDALDALSRKDEAGLLQLTPGGYADAIKAGVDAWQRRVAANENREDYSIGISVPTNADARAVGAEIRKRLRAQGKIVGGEFTIRAQDQNGAQFDLDIAVGDTVRLFRRVHARYGQKSRGYFGENGTTAEIVSIDPHRGLRLKRADGKVGEVGWSTLQDKMTGRVLLTYGTALTIDTRQSETLTDHVTILPAGTQAITAFKMYPADTRNREDSVVVVSHGAEKEEVRNRRPIGDPWLAEATDQEMRKAIVQNMARNLSRQPEKGLAVDFLDAGIDVFRGAVNSMQAAWHRSEQAAADAREPDLADTFRQRREEAAVVSLMVQLKRSSILANGAVQLPAREDEPKPNRQERRRQTAAPRKERKAPARRHRQDDIADVKAAFAEALRAQGLKPTGDPVMDGSDQYVPVDGNRGRERSGLYRGYVNGQRPAGVIFNFKEGTAQTWKMAGRGGRHSADEQRRFAQERAADRARHAAERLAKQEQAGKRAYRKWRMARQAGRHDYLREKDVHAHGLRQTADGRLLVPMRDAGGFIRNVQTILRDRDDPARHEKLFEWQGQKLGLFHTLGSIAPDKPILIAEGYATAATVFETTGLATIVAFDTGNLRPVAEALRQTYPATPIVFAADNDHTLPRKPVAEGREARENVGVAKALAAAASVGGVVIHPRFGPDIETGPLLEGQKYPSDWNDAARLWGKAKVGAVIEAELKAQGITMPDRKPDPIDPTRTVTEAERKAARNAHQSAPTMDPAQRNAMLAQQEAERQRRRHNRGLSH